MAKRKDGEDEIVLKNSGRRARVDDLDETPAQPPVRPPAASRPPAPPRRATDSDAPAAPRAAQAAAPKKPAAAPKKPAAQRQSPARDAPPASRPEAPTASPPAKRPRVYPPPTPQTRVQPPGGLPPGGGPPARYVHDDEEPWWQSRTASVGAAVVLVLAVVAVVAVVLLSGSNPRDAVATDLANAKAAVEDAMTPVGRATKLQQIRNAGRKAREQIDRLSGPAANLANMGNKDLAEPAGNLIAKERQYIEALASLEGVTQGVAEDPELQRWRSIKNGLVDAHRVLATAAAGLDKLELSQPSDELAVTSGELQTTLNRVDETVVGANKQLMAFADKLKSHNNARGRAKRAADVIGQYKNRVDNVLNQYGGERRTVGEWARSVAPKYERDETDKAETKVRGFFRDRSSTISRLETALGAAPDTVKSYHKDLIVPLNDSLSGLSKISEAISEFSFSSEFDDMTQTEAWQGFQDDSEAAEENLTSVRGLWANAVTAEIKKALIRGVPPRPKKPSV